MLTLRSLTDATQMTTSNVLLLLNHVEGVECVSRTRAPSTQRLASEAEMSVGTVIVTLF
jgi:hypothetical protein